MGKIFMTIGVPLSQNEVVDFIKERWNEKIDTVIDLRKMTHDALMDALDDASTYEDHEDVEFDGDVFARQDKINRTLEEMIQNGENILLFGQNHTPQVRLFPMRCARKYNKQVYVIIDCPDIEELRKVYASSSHYNMSVIRHFTIPLPNEFEELAFIPRDATSCSLNALYESATHHHIKSNHHNETIIDHGSDVGLMMREKGYSKYICHAAELHDIGKIDTMSISKDGSYHYYGHPNASAYRLCTAFSKDTKNATCETEKEIYMAVAMVCHHMAPYDWETEGQKLYNKRLYGEKLYDVLIDMNEADRKASLRED